MCAELFYKMRFFIRKHELAQDKKEQQHVEAFQAIGFPKGMLCEYG